MYPVNQTWVSHLEQLKRLTVYALIFVAGIVLLIRLLLPQATVVSLIQMKSLSAAGFLLCGLILYFRKKEKLSTILSTTLLLLSSLFVLQYLLNIDLGLALFQSGTEPIYHDLMTFATAVTFVLLSTNFLLISHHMASFKVSQWLATAVFLIAFTVLLAQVFDISIQSEYNEWSLMAPLSCVLLMLLTLCQFSWYPEQGFLPFILQDTPGISVIIKLFAMLLLFPVIFGSIISGFPEGAIPKGYELALFALSYTIFFGILLFHYSLVLHRHTLERLKQEEIRAQLNEELITSNEDLQATNEQLAKAGEQIQELTRQALQKSENRYRQLADNLLDAFCAIDKDMCFSYWNQAAEALSGLSSKEVMGRHLLDVFPIAEKYDFPEKILEVKHSNQIRDIQIDLLKNGRRRYFDVRIYPTDEGVSLCAFDITQIKDTKARIRQETERLELIFMSTDLGAWDWHIPSGDCVYNDQWAKMVGARNEDLPQDISSWEDRVHPDDKAEVLEQLQAHFDGKTPHYKAEHRLRRNDGSWFWSMDIGKVVERDEQGQPLRMVGIHQDIDRDKNFKTQLKEQKDHLELALQSSGMATWDWDIVNGKAHRGSGWSSLLGYSDEELKNSDVAWYDLVHPDDIRASDEAAQKHFRGETDYHFVEHRLRHKDGNWIWAIGSGKVIEWDKQGNPTRMIGIERNINELKEKEEETRQQKERLEMVLQGAALGTWDWHAPSGSVTFNERWASMLGYRLEEIKPHVDSWAELVHPDDMPMVMDNLQPHLDGKTDRYQTEHRVKTKDGGWKWILDSGRVLERDEQGKAVRVVGIHMDIDHTKRLEIQLRSQKEKLELTLEGAELGTWDWHIPSDRVDFDNRWAAMLGYQPEDLRPHADTWQSLVHPDDMPVIMEHLPLHLEGTLDNFHMEYRMKTKSGEWKWLLDSARVIERDAEGNPLRMMGIHLDIDRMKKVEEELREQKNNLELALWAAELGTWERDFRSNTITVDARSAQLLGYEQEEFGQLLTRQMDKLFHPDDRQEALQNVDKHLKGEIPFYRQQHRTLCKNGEWKWVMNTGKVVERDAQGNPLRFVGVQQDISEIKKVESDLRFFKYFTNNSLNPAYAIDPADNFRMAYVNEAACQHYGYSREELLQMRIVDWDPDFTEADSHAMQELLRREKFTIFETRHKRKDGSIVPVQVTASLTLFEGKEYFTGYIQDISERKAAEKKIRQANNRLESRVKERTAELEATNRELEAFSYSVSHDLRSPLRSIDGFSKALVEDYYELLDEDGKDFLQSIRNATARMGNLIDDMLKLSRISRAELKREQVDISQQVDSILNELKKNHPDREVNLDLTPNLLVRADPKMLNIALRNLLENAWKFTREQPQASISFGQQEDEAHQVFFIQDNGAGFDMEYAHKLFGAFQRLHHQDEFEGSGIGLATVQRIIHRHGGRIWAEAEPGQGACFYFYLD